MEPFDRIVDGKDIPTLDSILNSEEYPLVQYNWVSFLRRLGVSSSQIKDYIRNVNTGTHKVADVICEGLEAWCGAESQNAKLSKIISIVEDGIGAKNAGEKLRLEFDLPCYGSDLPNLGWADLGDAFQEKVREVLDRDYENVDVDVNKLSQPELVALMTNGKPKLYRDPPPKLPYYICRTFVSKNVLSCRKIFELDIPDIFLFTGLTSRQLREKIPEHSTSDSTYHQLYHRADNSISVRLMVLDVESHFEKVCDKTEESVHWVHYQNGVAELIKSKRKMDNVKKCIHELPGYIGEAKLITQDMDSKGPATIISGSLGMGKSTTLAYLASNLVELDGQPERHISLATVTQFLTMVKDVGWIDMGPSPIQEVVVELVCENELGKADLRAKLKSETVTIQLLLDGYDEIPDGDGDLAIKVLSAITAHPSLKLWITTRPHKSQELENALSVLSHKLLPFDREDKLNFLTQYWTTQNKEKSKLSPEFIKRRFREFGNSCLLQLTAILQSENYDIAKSPLSCLLIAEVYEDNAAEFVIKTSSSKLQFASIASLYDRLTRARINSYLSSGENTDMNEDKIMLMHADLAMQLLFPDYKTLTDCKYLADEPFQPEPEVLLKIGLVESDQGTLRFIHRSFAEYFLAWFTVETLKPKRKIRGLKINACGIFPPSTRLVVNGNQIAKLIDFIFKGVLMTVNNEEDGETPSRFIHRGICFFINSQLAEGEVQLGNANRFQGTFSQGSTMKSIANACVNDDLFCIFKVFHNKKAFDKHAGNIFDNKFLLATVSNSSSSEFIELIYTSPLYLDKYHEFGKSLQTEVLLKLVQKGDFSTLDFLVKKAKSFNYLKNKKGNEKNTIFHDCVQSSKDDIGSKINGKLEVIDILVGINKNLVNVKDSDGLTPFLCLGSNVSLLQRLLEKGQEEAGVLALNSKNDTVLHFDPARCDMSSQDYDSLMRCIAPKQLEELVKVFGEKDDSPLMRLVKNMDPLPETLDLFKKAKAEFNEIDTNDDLPILAVAIKSGRSSDTIEKLIKCGSHPKWKSDNGESLFHIAAKFGNVEAVIQLSEIQMIGGVNSTDRSPEGLTPLDYAIRSDKEDHSGKRFDVGMKLHEKGGTFTAILNNNQTWLHVVAEHANYDSIRLLLKLEVNINQKDANGNTALHLAVMTSTQYPNVRFDVVRLLLDNGSDADILTSTGKTALSLALGNPAADWETVRLLKSRTNVPWTSEEATLALKLFLDNSTRLKDRKFIKFVEGFVDGGADLNSRNSQMQTILHKSVNGIKDIAVCLDTIKHLISKGANVTLMDNEDMTFLPELMSKGLSPSQLDKFVKFLFEEEIVDVSDSDGLEFLTTLLRLAVLKLEVESSTLELLHDNGVDFCLTYDDGSNLLTYAILGGRSTDVFAQLKDFGTDLNVLDSHQRSLLHIAAQAGNVTALQFLLDSSNLDVNAVDESGNSPLHFAVFNWRVNLIEIVHLLKEKGANPDLSNEEGATPKSIAQRQCPPDIYNELGFDED